MPEKESPVYVRWLWSDSLKKMDPAIRKRRIYALNAFARRILETKPARLSATLEMWSQFFWVNFALSQKNKRKGFVVAEKDGVIVGALEFDATETKRNGVVENVFDFVEPAHYRKGIADKLLHALKGFARAKGARVIETSLASEASKQWHETYEAKNKIRVRIEKGVKVGKAESMRVSKGKHDWKSTLVLHRKRVARAGK